MSDYQKTVQVNFSVDYQATYTMYDRNENDPPNTVDGNELGRMLMQSLSGCPRVDPTTLRISVRETGA